MSVGNHWLNNSARIPVPALPLTTRLVPTFVGGKRAKLASASTADARLDPLYMFYCGLQWHKNSDSSAGWELIAALRSWDRGVRGVAAALLAKTEHARLLVRDLRRTRSGLYRIATEYALERDGQDRPKAVTMNTPYGLEMSENCVSCKLRKGHWFCSLSSGVLQPFSTASHLSTYPGNAILFVEGQMPRGAFVLCSGKVKLSTTSRDGKVLIVKMAEAGEVLGLSAVISGTCFEVTAETATPCQVNFIEREALLRLMEKHGELGLRSAQTLSADFQTAYRDIHELVLARSSAGKLARLILSWTPSREKHTLSSEIRIRNGVTHEEMAQMIGASRETVTRLLSDLKKRELIRLEGSTLVIRNRTALEAMSA
ncbi:MAG TPA: Crp/Fnr family transcriptional regulator [Terriglobales bacterium]|nr:Crp/Fnr family transcriptional regulator [Terriglobales bacterium]